VRQSTWVSVAVHCEPNSATNNLSSNTGTLEISSTTTSSSAPNCIIGRALLSVSDKHGLVDFARGLQAQGIELLSTGGTAKLLREADIAVTDVSAHTGFPEIMGGRVKTLHPLIHGGILGRRGVDEDVMREQAIAPIDLVVVNLYPFAQTIAQPDCSLSDAIENIDIGGPAMVRSAAKNNVSVTVVTNPDDYSRVLKAVEGDGIPAALRFELAASAFAHTAQYDAMVANYLTRQISGDKPNSSAGAQLNITMDKIMDLRYGENPHQQAAFYRERGIGSGNVAAAKQVQGKELSYNNIADTDAALECVKQFEQPACVIVKHANPCGVAQADTPLEAYQRAYQTDPTSAFGGIIAFNRPLDHETVEAMLAQQFVEVVIAPQITDAARKSVTAKSAVRVLECGELHSTDNGQHYARVCGGLLVQNRDTALYANDDEPWRVVTQQAPDATVQRDLAFAWKVSKYVKSNAIVFCRDLATLGVGAGQMSRVYSSRIAAIKAADADLPIAGAVMASDAFFPFRDGIDAAADAGISAVIQPGGSRNDDEVIAAANEHGMTMVFTGMRHFRH